MHQEETVDCENGQKKEKANPKERNEGQAGAEGKKLKG